MHKPSQMQLLRASPLAGTSRAASKSDREWHKLNCSRNSECERSLSI